MWCCCFSLSLFRGPHILHPSVVMQHCQFQLIHSPLEGINSHPFYCSMITKTLHLQRRPGTVENLSTRMEQYELLSFKRKGIFFSVMGEICRSLNGRSPVIQDCLRVAVK